ncbi:MAG: thrombospondin type 3 repeat-containing protein [Limisphaerales bacterium]
MNNLLSATNADADGDGVNNLKEYLAGTDPLDSKSYLHVGTDQAVAQGQHDSVIYWPSVLGKQYVIERSTALFPPVWTPISTNNGTGGYMEIHDASGATTVTIACVPIEEINNLNGAFYECAVLFFRRGSSNIQKNKSQSYARPPMTVEFRIRPRS